jgi:hypothetical protein
LDDVLLVGVRHVWSTFLGLEGTHDGLVGNDGAYAAIIAAMEHCATVGLGTGAKVVVSTRNLGESGELARRIRALGAQRFVPTYVQAWSHLGASYESIRPTADDLRGLPPDGLDVSWGYHWFWSNPETFTEGRLLAPPSNEFRAMLLVRSQTSRTSTCCRYLSMRSWTCSSEHS